MMLDRTTKGRPEAGFTPEARFTPRPLKPPFDDGGPQPHRDSAKGGYPLRSLENLLQSCMTQPNDWRIRADKAHAYYDMGKQLSAEQEAKIRQVWGIEPNQTNLIHGVINGVLGQEARSRSDVSIEADDDAHQDVADVLSVVMKEARREANIDMAVSNGYAGMVKGGIAWVEVSRAVDPLDYPYRVRQIDRRQIHWDWESRELDLSDARWLIRRRWEDLDEAIAWMPEHEEVLRRAIHGWDLGVLPDDTDHPLYLSYRNEIQTTISRDEWCDSLRRRLKLFEVWYRVPAWAPVLHLGAGRRVMFDQANPLHAEAVRRGIVKVSKAVTRQVRMAMFAGPHRLLDVATTRRHFPYVPFWCFRDDGDRSPYGLIEGMIGPQDEYNERRQMIHWLLKARQVTMDSDALDPEFNTIADIERNAGRPDFMAILNPNRRNANALSIASNLQLQKEQVDVMQDSKQLIQEVPRIYSTQLGNAPTGVTSGIAINSLTEAGHMAMGEANDNYRFARKLVHEHVLDLAVEDHLEQDMRVTLGSGDSRRVVVLNAWDPSGMPVNQVKDAPVKVGLADVPSSPAYRMQEQQQVSQLIQALANIPEAVRILAPVFVENSSVQNRQQIADELRRATGQPVAGDRKRQAQMQQAQQAQLEKQRQIAEAAAAADIQEKRTKALVNQSTAQLNAAKARSLGVETAMSVFDRQNQQDPANDEDARIEQSIAEASRR